MTKTKQVSQGDCARALEGVVVLDIAGALGNYCGKLFADLGADVILVEPTTGAPTRSQAPWIKGRNDPESSLVFQYQNSNKRSIALDLDTPEAQDVLRALVKKSHVLIESEQPGVMKRRGLGYEELSQITPGLVMTSITPFGQDGPYANWLASDLVGMAMGGMLYLAGYTDTAPMVAFGEQAIGAANLFAAVATMAAVYDAEATNSGQHVDVSMQEAVVMGMENAVQFYDLEGSIRKRNAGEQRLAGTGVFQCKDGYVYLMAGGVGGNRFWADTAQWLIDEGLEHAEELKEACWQDNEYLASTAAKTRFTEIFSLFALAHTKAQLQEKGRTRRIPIAPICDTSDVNKSEQRQYRGYFIDVEASGGSTLSMPGAPYRLSETPWSVKHGAPRLGQHTQEILRGIGVTRAQEHALANTGHTQ